MISGRPTFYTPQVTKKWESGCARDIATAFPGLLLDVPIDIEVVFSVRRPPTVRRPVPSTTPDLDNYVKSFLDAFQQSGVLANDGLVTTIIACKRYAEEGEIPNIQFRWRNAIPAGESDAGVAEGAGASYWICRCPPKSPSGEAGAEHDSGSWRSRAEQSRLDDETEA